MIKGLGTVVYSVPDIARAKAWYAEVFDQQPYFDEPFYVGFNVGGFELGIVPEGEATFDRPVSTAGTAYWGVADAAAAHARLISLGAVEHEVIQDVGEGIKIGAVRDPFGNILGVIENPHFKLA